MTRAQIVERLARGLYEREKVRDRTSHEEQAAWEDLNVGRRATRLHYANELFEVLSGGFGFSWEMVDALRACLGKPEESDAPADAIREEVERAIGIIETLLPPRIPRERKGNGSG